MADLFLSVIFLSMNRKTLTTSPSSDYELLDSGMEEKLERYGNIVLARPDPQALWEKHLPEIEWKKADGFYERKGKEGEWHTREGFPSEWKISFGDLRFLIRPTSFKHTGLFPEQLSNWEWVQEAIRDRLQHHLQRSSVLLARRQSPGRQGEARPFAKEIAAAAFDSSVFVQKEVSSATKSPRALVFDFQYSDHQGVIVYIRLFDGQIQKGDTLEFSATGRKFNALEVGTFAPTPTPLVEGLSAGSIGYIVTGIKEPGLARVGDTVRAYGSRATPLSGYAEPRPVVWASVYPESQDDFVALRQALSRLRLSDSSLSFEEESSGMLGRGFRCGLLGMLHLEIVTERLHREFDLSLVVTTPTITYEVETRDGKRHTVYSPPQFPEYGQIEKVWEPFVDAEIILPTAYLGILMPLLFEHEAVAESTVNFSEDRVIVKVVMPLRELMRNFFDKLKSVSSGYASISYELRELRVADVVRLDILVADEIVPAFSRIVARHRADEEAIAAVEKLYKALPRQMFTTKIQAQALGRIISSRTLSAMSKDVTQHMYGGDITRKMKLREKQKKGKARMKARGSVNIPEDVFIKMIKSE